MSGKTTLDQYLTVPGDIDPIPIGMRTTHPVQHGQFAMPRSTKKQIRWKGERLPIISADIGGQQQYWNMWADDLVKHNRDIIFYVVDERMFTSPQRAAEAIAGFQYIVDIVTNTKYPATFSRLDKKRAKRWKPKVVCLLFNKMDVWWSPEADAMWKAGLKRQSAIATPFQHELRRLRRAGIPTNVEAIAAQYGLNVEKAIVETIRLI
tara:strand:- start:72549 stop:73169 length:621 start_codon:yes stop_codon:yes gene_type:complete